MRIPQKDIGPVPSDAFEDYSYITGIAKTQGRLLVILDIKSLLSESELKQSTNPITKKDSKPTTPNTNSVMEEDDIPPELKAVFDEDSAGIKPTEISRGSEAPPSHDGANQVNDFQLRVNQESESYPSRS